jgi:hypothetical protein
MVPYIYAFWTFPNPNGDGEMANATAKSGIISKNVKWIRIGIPFILAI